MADKRELLSTVDSFGVLYDAGDSYVRHIHEDHACDVRDLFESGLVARLISENLIPDSLIISDLSDRIKIHHKKIKPLVYPFEWSPEMLRSAAKCILKVNTIAGVYGYELKDAHPYNIVFDGLIPKFVDLGSFVLKPREVGSESWVAYEEFLCSFFYPLSALRKGLLSTYKSTFLLGGSNTTRLYEWLIILNPIVKLLGLKVAKIYSLAIKFGNNRQYYTIDYLRSKLGSNFLAYSICWLGKIYGLARKRNVNSKLMALIDSLQWNNSSYWANYHDEFNSNGAICLSPRLDYVKKVVLGLKPLTVLELAGNQGALSRELVSEGGFNWVLCTDSDMNAIDKLFLGSNETGLSAAVFNFMGEDWQLLSGNERANRIKADVVIALAVVHHIFLSQGYSFEMIVERLFEYAHKYLLVEFMPLGLWNGSTAPQIPAHYNKENFEIALSSFGKIERAEQLESNRILYVVNKYD